MILPHSFGLTQESQKILNNYHNFEQLGSPPATSQQYSPNNSPYEINAVPTPKTNVIPPASQPTYSSSSNIQNNSPASGTHMTNQNGLWGFVILIVIIVILAGIVKSRGKSSVSSPPTSGPLPRRGWTELEKEQVRIYQNGKCNKCGRPPPRWEYHHKDGNRSNNSLRNCEGLCPNCHSVRTHDE